MRLKDISEAITQNRVGKYEKMVKSHGEYNTYVIGILKDENRVTMNETTFKRIMTKTLLGLSKT